jgi:hypothetical protein
MVLADVLRAQWTHETDVVKFQEGFDSWVGMLLHFMPIAEKEKLISHWG